MNAQEVQLIGGGANKNLLNLCFKTVAGVYILFCA
jgi:hypothetical protein